MQEQLESVIPDAEIQKVCEEIAGTVEGAYDLLLKRRDLAFTVGIEGLEAERENLEKERAAIAEAARNLAELLPAKARRAQAEHDRLLLAGDREGAALKLAEQKEAEAAPATMKARQAEISARLEAIAEEKKALARRIFKGWYPQVQAVIRATERGLFATLLDGIEQSLFDFQNLTKTNSPNGLTGGLFHEGHIAGLTSDERSAEWRSGRKWYAGRG